LTPTVFDFDDAIYLDGSRDFPFQADDTTRLQGLHPVDQRVGFALLVRQGGIASAPDVGSTYHLISPALSGAALTADVERRTRLALAKLIAAGDIALVSVAATRARSGRLSIRVTYSNLRTARQKTLTVG
jgi:hypothetical protein